MGIMPDHRVIGKGVAMKTVLNFVVAAMMILQTGFFP
jgi:hypothetical protein